MNDGISLEDTSSSTSVSSLQGLCSKILHVDINEISRR